MSKAAKCVKSTKGCSNPRLNVLSKCQKLQAKGWNYRDGECYSSAIVHSGATACAYMVKD